jgi:hypothetical protein
MQYLEKQPQWPNSRTPDTIRVSVGGFVDGYGVRHRAPHGARNASPDGNGQWFWHSTIQNK